MISIEKYHFAISYFLYYLELFYLKPSQAAPVYSVYRLLEIEKIIWPKYRHNDQIIRLRRQIRFS